MESSELLASMMGVKLAVAEMVLRRSGGDINRAAAILLERDHSQDTVNPSLPAPSSSKKRKLTASSPSLKPEPEPKPKQNPKQSKSQSAKNMPEVNDFQRIHSSPWRTSFSKAKSRINEEVTVTSRLIVLDEDEDSDKNHRRPLHDDKNDDTLNLSHSPFVRQTVLNGCTEVVNHKAEVVSPAIQPLVTAMEDFRPVKAEHMFSKYAFMAEAFDALNATTKRLEKQSILVNFFRQLMLNAPETLLPAVRLSSNTLSNSFEDFNLGIGGAIVSQALQAATSCTHSKLSALYRETGDLGDAAFRVKSAQRLLIQPLPLKTADVYNNLRRVGAMNGTGSQNAKLELLVKMLRSCRGSEVRWLTRTLIGNIRTGATATTILGALSVASLFHHGSSPDKASCIAAVERLKVVISLCPDIDLVTTSLLQGGLNCMEARCKPQVCFPIQPMLAKPTTSIDESIRKVAGVIERERGAEVLASSFTGEYKYDGQRAQIHYNASKFSDNEPVVKIFSRLSEDMTLKFPDVVQSINDIIRDRPVQSLVLDAEIVPVVLNKSSRARIEQILPFQELSRRKRKDVSAGSVEVDVAVFVFDILFRDGESMLNESLEDRRAVIKDMLSSSGTASEATVHMAECVNIVVEDNDISLVDACERIEQSLQASVQYGCEGLILKRLVGEKSAYVPSRGSERSDAWLKLKKDYLEGLGDTFDLVVMGAWYGNGRKANWYSPYLLACFNPETSQFQSVCRVLSGFTDEFYKESKTFYESRVIDPEVAYQKGLVTDDHPKVFFEPIEVWEIKGADLTLSPVHKAGVGILHPDRGLSLRFPRFIRKRLDKSVREATTASQLIEAFSAQAQRQKPPASAITGAQDHGGDDEWDDDTDIL